MGLFPLDRHHEDIVRSSIEKCPPAKCAAQEVGEQKGHEMTELSRRQLFSGAAGLAVVGGLAAACGTSSSPGPTSTGGGAPGAPKRGGNFRLGVTGGGSKDIMDGQNIITKPDQARLVSAFETLLLFDENYQLTTNGLAESVTQDNPTHYTIKLRKGIEFQNGKTLTADDVIYSIQRIGTKKFGLTGYAATATMDIAGMKKLDQYTVGLPLHSADSTIPQTLASYTFCVVPVGYQGYPHPQIGTGAYKLKSFTPGQQSVHERNPNYWRSGEPYFDTVTITDFSDSTAQVNALLGGQIDAMTDLPPSQVKVVQARGLGALVSKTGGWLPICMAIDLPPSTMSGSARRCACSSTGRGCSSRSPPATGSSAMTSTPPSTPATTTRCRSEHRTSARPRPCSRRPAMRT